MARSNSGLEAGERGVRMVDSLSSFLTTSLTYHLISSNSTFSWLPEPPLSSTFGPDLGPLSLIIYSCVSGLVFSIPRSPHQKGHHYE